MRTIYLLPFLLAASAAAHAEDKCADYRTAAAVHLKNAKIDKSGLGAHETCTIGLVQDAKGNIESLNLKRCPPTIRARVAQDLLKASPLPASPDSACIAGEQTWSFGP